MELHAGTGLLDRLKAGTGVIGVMGLGYVGLPLAVTAAARGLTTVGFDVDKAKIDSLVSGKAYIDSIDDTVLKSARALSWTTDPKSLASCDVIVICVPTPLTDHREPDLSYVRKTASDISEHMTSQTLVVLESTSYPGTTSEVVMPILERSGLKPGEDFFLAFSPEREDPGNRSFDLSSIPKIVAGDGEAASELVKVFYESIVDRVVPVSSTQTAEAIKITENIFRAVNVALANELKVIYDAMGIDVWEVIAGASTKPFGFMPFYPGPGLGGHCIPIDPFYLSWKAREFELNTRFIELAGEINSSMPDYVVAKVAQVIDTVHGKGLRNSKVLIVGVAYKKNISDTRESPSMRIMKLMQDRGADVSFLDPLVPELPKMRKYPQFLGKQSVRMENLGSERPDAIVIATDHDEIDYEALGRLEIPIVDTRNAYASRGFLFDHIFSA